MLFVVDFNVIFSASVSKGNCFKVFKKNSEVNKFEFISPAFVFSEIDDNRDRLYSLAKLNKEQLDSSLALIKSQIKPISFSEFSELFAEAMELNKKDSPYLALALKRNCPIFSGDKKLGLQSKVKVFSPRDLLDIIESEE